MCGSGCRVAVTCAVTAVVSRDKRSPVGTRPGRACGRVHAPAATVRQRRRRSQGCVTQQEAPFIVDISHTAVARGKIYLAKDKKEAIPDHWALSKDGVPTTEPSEAIAGTLLPMAGHKGFGLSAMMDVLSGILSNSSFGTSVNGPYVPDQPSGVGHFLFAIDIAKLRDISAFKADMDKMITSWKQSQCADGVDEIFYPGEKEYNHFQSTQKNGLFLPEETLKDLFAYAGECGLPITLANL